MPLLYWTLLILVYNKILCINKLLCILPVKVFHIHLNRLLFLPDSVHIHCVSKKYANFGKL